jgi:hypothetical protein
VLIVFSSNIAHISPDFNTNNILELVRKTATNPTKSLYSKEKIIIININFVISSLQSNSKSTLTKFVK